MDQLPRLGKRELICLLLFTCNYVVSVSRGFLFLWVLGMGYVTLLLHSPSLHIIILYYIILYAFNANISNNNNDMFESSWFAKDAFKTLISSQKGI